MDDGPRTAHAGYVTEAVGGAIREAREARGLRIKDVLTLLAEEGLGVTQPAVTQWETGKRPIAIRDLLTVERALRLPRGYLFVRGGLAPPAESVTAAVAADSALDEAGRSIVLNAYDAEVERVAAQRRPPARAGRRRS